MNVSPSGRSSLLDTLTDINLDDLLDSAGLAGAGRTPLRWLLRPTARRFARVAHEFDQRVGCHGLAQGSAWMVQQMSAGLQVRGADQVPASGPVVILANHPGMTDTVALIASLAARPDLRVIALDRPFLRALPQVARQLIFVPDDEAARLAVVRAAAKHLRSGGALLSFPAGRIEPDPATFGPAQAVAALQRWSGSFALLARLAPHTRCVPAIVSDVVSPQAQRHPLTWLRRAADDKQRLAAALQVAWPRYRQRVARVAFGPALRADGVTADALRAALLAQARQLIEASAGEGDGDGRQPAPPDDRAVVQRTVG